MYVVFFPEKYQKLCRELKEIKVPRKKLKKRIKDTLKIIRKQETEKKGNRKEKK